MSQSIPLPNASPAATRFVVGCMTGTSLDGLDAALVAINGRGLAMQAKFIGMVGRPLDDLRDELRHFASGGAAEPIRYMRAARRLGELHADAVEELCKQEGCHHLDFVVAHGQTIWHAPGQGVSWQLFDPWPIVRRLRLPVCYDLRQADLIAGGQGAPITPLSDWVMYRRCAEKVVIVNLGGVCNVTYLEGSDAAAIRAGDIGPCNLAIDGVVARLFPGRRYDDGGQIAAAGKASPYAHAFLTERPAPAGKSLGREDFTDAWVSDFIAAAPGGLSPADIVASVVAAVGRWIRTRAIDPYKPDLAVLAGGGVKNPALRAAIAASGGASPRFVDSDSVGIPCEAREAMGFAVLGALSQDGVPITLPGVTGAKKPGRAGAWAYP